MFLFPDLQTVKSPSKKLGEYMTSVLPKEQGGLAKYKDIAVSTLPKGMSAGGVRPGACNVLTSSIPVEHAV
eukprot:6196095-Prymnesium_polylepis.1